MEKWLLGLGEAVFGYGLDQLMQLEHVHPEVRKFVIACVLGREPTNDSLVEVAKYCLRRGMLPSDKAKLAQHCIDDLTWSACMHANDAAYDCLKRGVTIQRPDGVLAGAIFDRLAAEIDADKAPAPAPA